MEGSSYMGRNETERQPAELKWGGRLYGDSENPALWRGKISAQPRILKERFHLVEDLRLEERLNRLKQKLEQSFTPASEQAPVRCIDGRGEDEATAPVELGPQAPGGTPVNALCWRLANWRPSRSSTIETDVEKYQTALSELNLPFLPGAHEDESGARHEENTGCGAIDKMLEVLSIMGERETMLAYLKAVAPEYCDEAVVDDVLVKLEILTAPSYSDLYFMKDESGVHRFRSKTVEKIKSAGRRLGRKNVEKLSGEHNEIFLVINKVEGETFDRDGFAAESDGKAQAFNYDLWFVAQRSQELFPHDETAQKTMLTASLMYAIATAMALTDGSLEYAIRG